MIMTRSAARLCGALGVLAGSWACDKTTTLVDPGVDVAVVQAGPVGVPGNTVGPRILIDASRDGGVWWFPQIAPYRATAYHQGQALADSLRNSGYVVEELPRTLTITGTLLPSYDIVMRVTGFGTYTQPELSAYQAYVNDGGKLLLLGDHMMHLPADGLALSFGIRFAGITRGENRITTFAPHRVTADVEPLIYGVGSGIVAQPPGATILARLSEGSYLDLNKNNVRDSTDTPAPAVLGVMPYGKGRIVFSGDTNLWEWIPQPLLGNVLAWFKEP
jgi:hypothetical protein